MSEDPNPIVAQANKIRARRAAAAALDANAPQPAALGEDAASLLEAFGARLREGANRLNAIVGKPGAIYVRLERPLRLRVRLGEKRIGLNLDETRQLVVVAGDGLDGEYQFDTGAALPALINLSKLSTEAGYGEALTPSSLLKHIARDAELPRPPHLDSPGPMRF
jgi:hypothetical protein